MSLVRAYCLHLQQLLLLGLVLPWTNKLPVQLKMIRLGPIRNTRVQNIFTLSGNYRQLSHTQKTPALVKEAAASLKVLLIRSEALFGTTLENKADNNKVQREVYDNLCGATQEKITEEPFKVNPSKDENDNGVLMDVFVKWKATKDNDGNFINKLKVVKDAILFDLLKLIPFHLGVDKQEFTFLSLADPTCAPLSREMESTMLASKLPTCNTQL